MKLLKLLFFSVLAAGLFVACGEGDVQDFLSYKTTLTASPGTQQLGNDGKAFITFKLAVFGMNNAVEDISRYTGTISFSAAGGSVSPASATTDGSGSITVVFTAPDPKNFEGGTVTAELKKLQENKQDGVFQQGSLATATATIEPMKAPDNPIELAERLKDNTYSIQKKGGDAQVFTFPEKYSIWYVGTSWMDGTKQCIHVECMDEDENNDTKGWLTGEIPLEVANKLTTINKEFYDKYPWAAAKLGTRRLGDNNMIDAHLGQGGNVKLDGSSQFYLKEKTGTKAYSGQYQFLFVLVFENQIWNQETETYLPGDEYTICGNATLDELVAELSDFRLDYSSNWLAPGQSITLTASWTAGAKFDWSKVTLNSQTRNGSSGEWFSWDAASQKLTATKSAENQEVELTFGYKGTNMTSKISLYNGPGYTSFTVSPRDGSSQYIVAENDPQGWSSNDYVYITVDSFKPDDYYSFNYHSIEIDPASDYYDKLYYNDYGPYVQFNHTIPEGSFDMILRSKADHSVKCTVPVRMVKHKVSSFTITYLYNNDYIHEDNKHGVCNYPMGLSLGVITTPEDAYWTWTDVELANDYDGFSFSGVGGKDDHPKLQRTKSNPGGGTSYGTQIIFRLKYDHKKTSTIYVDHN